MSVLSVLYTLLIYPLELMFEVVFSIANRMTGNPGISIIVLSLTFNLLVFPLYRRADELQKEERDIQAKMAYRIGRIKRGFRGDERFMMLREYYRVMHYKPVYALKSSVSLLLQIPFFIAAYRLLSGMQSLQGMAFGFIRDLSREDALFTIGDFPVNILPILMTAVNIISGIIYTRGQPLKAGIRVFGLAAVFFVLLYHSPSGLVFYWLLNNVFSLAKNLFTGLNGPQKVLHSISGLINKKKSIKNVSGKGPAFFEGTLLLALITGLLIPATVINASAEEFINVLSDGSPVLYIINSLLLSLGCWVIWGNIFYFFVSGRTGNILANAVWIICGISVCDYMLFGTKLGTLSSTLQYDIKPSFSISEYLINTFAVAAVALVFGFIFSRWKKTAQTILLAGILTVICIGAYNVVKIGRTYADYRKSAAADVIPEITLSRTGQNVIVLMLDRSVGDLVPYIMEEKPELKAQFDGFTYYPNTISFGAHTNTGAPALYGGYEYTPEKMNERDTELLADKHDEALKVMPVIFGDNGYNVTVIDPPYAGYNWIPRLSIYDDYPEFNCYATVNKHYFLEDSTVLSEDASVYVDEIRNRNLFMFSVMKTSPLIFQEIIYDGGIYNTSRSAAKRLDGTYETDSLVQNMSGLSVSTGYDLNFLEAYAVLGSLSDITTVNDDPAGNFLMMANKTTHAPCLLQEPGYVPAYNVDNTAYDTDLFTRYTIDGKTLSMHSTTQVSHYHINMAAFIQLGKWFDYLREKGVYDNTRIILVSDHAFPLDYYGVKCNREDMSCFLPLLMVKDFDAAGFTVCNDFMTNADTPMLAASGLIEDPVNPFTNNPIFSDMRNGPQTVFLSNKYNTSVNNGTTYIKDTWYEVSGDPHKSENWNYLGTW